MPRHHASSSVTLREAVRLTSLLAAEARKSSEEKVKKALLLAGCQIADYAIAQQQGRAVRAA